MDQPGKVAANPARDQLNREDKNFPVPPVRDLEFGLARRVATTEYSSIY